MTPVNGKILVRCNMRQKDTITIGNVTVSTALKFETNYRERCPVVVVVEQGNKWVKKDDILIVHHNTLYTPSPFFVGNDMFSIPFNGKIVFGKLNTDGTLTPIGGNILCQRVQIPTFLPVATEDKKTYIDRAIITNAAGLPYLPGQLVFHTPEAAYDIVYNHNKVEMRVTKVHSDFIVGFVK